MQLSLILRNCQNNLHSLLPCGNILQLFASLFRIAQPLIKFSLYLCTERKVETSNHVTVLLCVRYLLGTGSCPTKRHCGGAQLEIMGLVLLSCCIWKALYSVRTSSCLYFFTSDSQSNLLLSSNKECQNITQNYFEYISTLFRKRFQATPVEKSRWSR